MVQLLKVMKGSKVYGTNIDTSDDDYFGLFKYSLDTYLSLGYNNQINNSKDDVDMEVRKFLKLLSNGSPGNLENLFTPEKFIVYKNPLLNELFENKQMFITKKLRNSYLGFLKQQLHKSKNITHRLYWEQNEVKRKTILDFCTVSIGNKGAINIQDYLQSKNLHISQIGLTRLNKMKDCYNMFYSEKENLIFNGIVNQENLNNDTATNVKLSSIPKEYESNYLGIMLFNISAYGEHCKKYKEYKHWLANRNPERYKKIIETGSIVDLKFFYHAIRLANTACEIFSTGELIVDRRGIDADYLLKVRNGLISLEELNTYIENKLIEVEDLYLKSNLPEEVNQEFLNQICINILKN